MVETQPKVDTVVVPDLHAHPKPLEAVVKEYGESVRYVVLGDAIGKGQNTADVLDIIGTTNMRLIKGNWEQQVVAGLVYYDQTTRLQVQDIARPFETDELRKFARSYGADAESSRKEMIQEITKQMQARGHLNLLARAALYFEAEDFVAIHAGLTPENWEKQREDLSEAKGTLEEVPQLFDDPAYSLSKCQEPFEATKKTVVTGHAHSFDGSRITAGGKRVRLGSNLLVGQPLFVWQSWDGKIKEFASK